MNAIDDGSIYANPSLLSSFIVLSYADLKKYKFHYWFGFPAIHSDPPWSLADVTHGSIYGQGQSSNTRNLTHQESSSIVDAVHSWSATVDSCQRGFFLAKKSSDLSGRDYAGNNANRQDGARFSWKIASLGEYDRGFFDGVGFENSYICFADPSNYASAPGWMLRNLLVLVKRRWGLNKIQVLLFRDVRSKPLLGRSVAMILETKQRNTLAHDIRSHDAADQAKPKITGWERNPSGKLTGRMVDLTEYMDPKR